VAQRLEGAEVLDVFGVPMTQTLDQSLLEAVQPAEKTKTRKWAFPFRGALLSLGSLACLILLVFFGGSFLLPNWTAGVTHGELNFLYVSFHGDGSVTTPLPKYGVNQVLRLNLEDLDAKPEPVLDWASSPTPPRMLRDMKLLKTGSLFVAQGLKFDSAILQYGPCDSTGKRQFVEEYRSPMLVHPYALTFIGDTLYASTQDSGTVMSFDIGAADKLSSGDRIHFNLHGDFRYRPGITYRGIASYKECLYLSVTEMDVVAVICNNLTHVSHRIPVRHPIGLLVDEEHQRLYIASPTKQKHEPGEIAVWDLESRRFRHGLTHDGMKHPTNMVMRGTSLIVASQTQKAILEFNRTTGAFKRTLFQGLPDAPENIMLSPC